MSWIRESLISSRIEGNQLLRRREDSIGNEITGPLHGVASVLELTSLDTAMTRND